MNKNFEIEYKKYVSNDTPDLWSRIESGIDKLEAANISSNTSNTDNKEALKNSRTKKVINLKPFIGIAAACACLLLLVSIAQTLPFGGGSSATSATAPAADYACEESAAEAMYEAAPAEEAAEDTTNSTNKNADSSSSSKSASSEPMMDDTDSKIIETTAKVESINASRCLLILNEDVNSKLKEGDEISVSVDNNIELVNAVCVYLKTNPDATLIVELTPINEDNFDYELTQIYTYENAEPIEDYVFKN